MWGLQANALTCRRCQPGMFFAVRQAKCDKRSIESGAVGSFAVKADGSPVFATLLKPLFAALTEHNKWVSPFRRFFDFCLPLPLLSVLHSLEHTLRFLGANSKHSTEVNTVTSQLSLAEQAACSFPGPKVDGVCCFSLSCHGPDFLEGTNWSCIVHLRSDPGISMPLKWTLDSAQRCLASGYEADVMFAYDCDFRNSCRCTRVLHRLCYLKTFNVCLRDWPEPQTDTNCYSKAMDGLGLVTTSSEPPLLKCIRAGCFVEPH